MVGRSSDILEFWRNLLAGQVNPMTPDASPPWGAPATTLPADVGAAAALGSLVKFYALADHVHAHGSQAGGALHAVVTGSAAGFVPAFGGAQLNQVLAIQNGAPVWITYPTVGNSAPGLAPALGGHAGYVLTDNGNGTASWLAAAGGGITALTGDVTASGTGSVAATVTKTNGVAFAASATTDTTDAGNISTGVLAIGRIPLGTSGSTVTVGNDARLSDSRPPNGPAGGDLSGTYPNPSVTQINGHAPAASATTDTTNADNISSGILNASRLPVVPTNKLDVPPATTGDVILSVATDGVDRAGFNVEGDFSAAPYLTIQGALNSLPVVNNHEVVIRVAAGTYTDAFTPPALQGSGSLRIIGTMAPAALTTGVNTGIMSAVTTNADFSWTITKPSAAAAWTPGNLRGKMLLITGGAGFPGVVDQSVFGIIRDNDATTATITLLLWSGVPIANLFNAGIDNTSQFQISSWATVINGPIPDGYLATVNPQGVENLFSLEQLYCTGPGSEGNEFCHASLCEQVQYIGNTFDGVANNGSAFFIENCGHTYALGNYHLEGSICNSAVGQTLDCWGLVGDHSTAIICQQIYAVSTFNNDFDFGNETHGDSAYLEAVDCVQIVDGSARLRNCVHDLYQFNNCPDVQIFGPTVSGIAGHALGFLTGPTNVVIDTKITGTAGDALMEDTTVTYSGAATGDSFQRGLCLLTYTGA